MTRVSAVGLLVVSAGPSACGEAPNPLVVHAPLDREVLSWAEERFESEHPGVDLRWMQVSGEETLRILRTGAGGERPDVWWGAPSWLLAAAAEEDLLVAAPPSWASAVPPAARDGEGRWTGALRDPLVIAFHRDRVSLARAPRDWIDLFHHRWAGEVMAPDAPATSAGALLVGTMVARDVAGGGDGGAGFDWLRRLDAAVVAYLGEEDLVRGLSRGPATFAILRLSDALRAADRDPAVAWRLPETGAPVLTEGVALVAGASAPEEGRAFLQWLGRPEVSAEVAGRLRRLGAGGATGLSGEPAALAGARETLRPWDVSADTLALHLDAWIRQWRSEVRGSAPRVR